MQLSKVVVRRKQQARAVLASIKAHGTMVAQQLEEKFAALRAENAPPPDYATVIQDLFNGLDHERTELEAADWAHLHEEANDRSLRRVRNEAARKLYAKFVEMSGTLDSAYGPGSSEEVLGLGKGMRPLPEQMLELARKAVAKLDDPDFELPAAQLDGVELSTESFRSQIMEHLEPLEAAIDNLAAEKANFYGTLKAKRDALASFDRVYVQGTKVLEGYYRLTGNDLWADTLRLTARRPTSSEEEPVPTEGDEDPPAVETVEVTGEPGPEVEPAA